MNIGLFTSVYFNNIGNGFIDLGAEATLKNAIPSNAQIIKVSQCANFAASMGTGIIIKELPFVHWIWTNLMQRFAKKVHDRTYNIISQETVFSVADFVKFDYFILPGCILTVPFFTIYGKLLEKKSKEGTKLIFLGASGNFYTEYEIHFVSEYLKKLSPYAIMTRDSIAYKHYAQFGQHSYNGIDNAFFVNLWNIPKVKTEMKNYVILNFDEPKHKNIRKELTKKFKNIVYTNHKPFPYLTVSKLVKKGIMVSDSPLDYLLLYANVSEVHSDRVHACIPTLAFGNKAQLYSDSPRIALFENVGIKNIKERPVKIQDLDIKQQEQIDFLKSILL